VATHILLSSDLSQQVWAKTRLSGRKRVSKTKKRGPYTRGQVNKAIDAVVHPIAEVYPEAEVLDTLLHVANEENPRESLQKWLKYSLPKLIQRLLKESN
jgi:hypothetical protein